MATVDLHKYSQDRTTQVGGVQVRYWSEGSQGSPVILIHGIGGYVENWWPNNRTLARQHRVFAVDLPGFGRSDKPVDAPYDMPYFATFVRDFMTALSLESASVVGHSMGGGVALQTALTFPQKVSRLVLVDSAGLGREMNLVLRVASLPVLGEVVTRPSLEGSRSLIKAIVHDPALVIDEDVRFDYEMSILPGAQRAFLKALRSLANVSGQKHTFTGPILDHLPAITQPTLVLWGRDDTVIPMKHADVARRIPDIRVRIFEHCGHMPQFEHPDDFDQVVQEFLAD